MAIPGFQSIMLPLLKIASDESEHNHAEVRDSLGIQFKISDSEKEEMLPSGKQARFSNRVAWAIVYLRRAGLIENSSRGIFHITVQGLDLLKTNPNKIDIKLLKQLNPEIKNWSKPSDQLIESIDIYRFFKDRDEAKWAFDLLRETLDRLGIKEPNDERFAVTCPSGGKALHLNFGQWLVLGFSNQDVGENRIEIALLADQANFYNRFESFDFAKGEDKFNIKIYKLPIELVRPLGGDLRTAYEKSLEQYC